MADQGDAPRDHSSEGSCNLCPLCLLIGAVGEANPEVREHLRAAGRELALAVRAALEAVDRSPGNDTGGEPAEGLRRIHLDEH